MLNGLGGIAVQHGLVLGVSHIATGSHRRRCQNGERDNGRNDGAKRDGRAGQHCRSIGTASVELALSVGRWAEWPMVMLGR